MLGSLTWASVLKSLIFLNTPPPVHVALVMITHEIGYENRLKNLFRHKQQRLDLFLQAPSTPSFAPVSASQS